MMQALKERSHRATLLAKMGELLQSCQTRDEVFTDLQEMLDREICRAIRSEQPLGILMLDLDHFKNFNDTYGHEAGDTVLRETGSFLKRSIRAEDFVCRYGGEEFVVILPTADVRAAESRA